MDKSQISPSTTSSHNCETNTKQDINNNNNSLESDIAQVTTRYQSEDLENRSFNSDPGFSVIPMFPALPDESTSCITVCKIKTSPKSPRFEPVPPTLAIGLGLTANVTDTQSVQCALSEASLCHTPQQKRKNYDATDQLKFAIIPSIRAKPKPVSDFTELPYEDHCHWSAGTTILPPATEVMDLTTEVNVDSDCQQNIDINPSIPVKPTLTADHSYFSTDTPRVTILTTSSPATEVADLSVDLLDATTNVPSDLVDGATAQQTTLFTPPHVTLFSPEDDPSVIEPNQTQYSSLVAAVDSTLCAAIPSKKRCTELNRVASPLNLCQTDCDTVQGGQDKYSKEISREKSREKTLSKLRKRKTTICYGNDSEPEEWEDFVGLPNLKHKTKEVRIAGVKKHFNEVLKAVRFHGNVDKIVAMDDDSLDVVFENTDAAQMVVESLHGHSVENQRLTLSYVQETKEYKTPGFWRRGKELVELSNRSSEYINVHDLFIKVCRRRCPYTVTTITRIQNEALYIQHGIYKERVRLELLEQNLSDNECAKYVLERDLWHGTTQEATNNICIGGFDRSYAGTRHGKSGGAGTYFAPSVDISASVSACATVILAHVVTGRITAGDYSITSANLPIGCHSTGNGQEHVVFHDGAAYPAYLVKFEHKFSRNRF